MVRGLIPQHVMTPWSARPADARAFPGSRMGSSLFANDWLFASTSDAI
jgi:hypothetical protein